MAENVKYLKMLVLKSVTIMRIMHVRAIVVTDDMFCGIAVHAHACEYVFLQSKLQNLLHGGHSAQ